MAYEPSKIYVTDAFRQAAVEWSGAPDLFGDFVVVDRRLEFGWANSPVCVCSAREMVGSISLGVAA